MTTNKYAIFLFFLIVQSLCQAMNEEQKTEYHAIRQMYENYGKPKSAELTVKIATDASGTETTNVFARLKTLKTTIIGGPLNEHSRNYVHQVRAIDQMQAMGLHRIMFGSTIVTQEPEEQLIQTIVKYVDGNETIINH
jgi:hypothetical protein